MWRTILLGKLSVSILATLLVGVICVTQPWRVNYPLSQSSKWVAVGVFFLGLGIFQIAAVYLMTKRLK